MGVFGNDYSCDGALRSPLCLFGPGGSYRVGLMSSAGATHSAAASSNELMGGVGREASCAEAAGDQPSVNATRVNTNSLNTGGEHKCRRTSGRARMVAYPGRGLVHVATRFDSLGLDTLGPADSVEVSQLGGAVAPPYAMGSSSVGLSLSLQWWLHQCAEDFRMSTSSVAHWVADACDRFMACAGALLPHVARDDCGNSISTRLVAVPIADVGPLPSSDAACIDKDATRSEQLDCLPIGHRRSQANLPPVVLGPAGLPKDVLLRDSAHHHSAHFYSADRENLTNAGIAYESNLYDENGCSLPLGSNGAGATVGLVELEVTDGPRKENSRQEKPRREESWQQGQQQQGKGQEAADTTAVADSDPHTGLSAQSWLFPVDAGVGRRPADIKGHRIRARRHARRKGPTVSESAQGTLFGTDVAGSAA